MTTHAMPHRHILPIALLTAAASAVLPAFAETVKVDDLAGYDDSGYWFSAWEQDFDFDRGGFTRTWQVAEDGKTVEYLRIDLEQMKHETFVGFDAGVGRAGAPTATVEDIAADEDRLDDVLDYTFTHDMKPVDDEDFWIQGPKCVISSTDHWVTLIGEYECYIVDTASHSREWIVEEYKLKEAGSDEYDGVTYHHYVRDLQSRDGLIYQVFSFRDEWTQEGPSPVNRVMASWAERDIVPGGHYCLGWKVNVETDGSFKAGSTFGWENVELPKL